MNKTQYMKSHGSLVWRSAALAIAALALSSCKFGPDYKKNDMAVPAEFRGGNSSSESVADLPWWKVLRNNELQSLLRDTYANNRDLKSMMANVDSARQYVTIARAPLFPWVSYGGGVSKGSNYAMGNMTQMNGVTTAPGMMKGAVSWEIDLWGKTRRATESAVAQYLASEEGQRALMLSLLRQVADGYLQLLQLDQELEITREAVTSYTKSLNLFQAQLDGGIGDKLQVASAEAALAASKAQVPALEAEIAALENTLSVLAGRTPGSIRRSGSLQSVAGAARVPAGLPAQILANRPDVRQKEFELRSANAEIGVAITNYFPSISLTGGGGLVSSDLARATKHKSAWGVGADLSGPLFQAGTLRANELVARNNFLAAKNAYEQSVLSALADVSTTLIQRAKLNEIIVEQEKAVAAYRTAVESSMDRYTNGLSSYYEVLTAQQNLFPALTALSQYRYQYASTLPTLYTALGGGWQQDNREMLSGASNKNSQD
ncbi:efflux transporter outer membrane subunit [Akkermansia glycaniphila]|uniref:Outer membrane efflux protein n=1 Tax=Akkermansia glycaniphila TaxID=1679444 RepID=A0A1H6M1L7_9BACT|nr:efflux transporter outer membrane subunit [Akkermansia glycaniphila]SEH95036.1 outer membrane efflux protein [Akkermansia glycaniphila]